MDLFSTFKRLIKQTFFHDAHTSAMVPPHGPAGTSRAFPQRIAGTLVGQEHASTETSRPLSTGPDPCGRLQSFGPPVLCYASHWVLGPRCSATHPAVTVAGPYWHSVCDGLHVFLVLGQHFRIVVIMRLRILATIASDLMFEIIRTFMAINSCTSPRSHIGTSSIPPPTTMGADPASAFFILALNRHTHPSGGPPFVQLPLGSHQMSLAILSSLC